MGISTPLATINFATGWSGNAPGHLPLQKQQTLTEKVTPNLVPFIEASYTSPRRS